MTASKLVAGAKLAFVILSLVTSQGFVARAESSLPAQVSEEQQKKQEADFQASAAGTDILWLARAIYSETKLRDEQLLVACVIDNRLENGYWGDTYKQVVLAPHQFSGLHPYATNRQYSHNISRTYQSKGLAWENALKIARAVYFEEDGVVCPLPSSTTHFYSPNAVAKVPAWAKKSTLVYESKGAGNYVRFAFHSGVMK